MALVSNKWILSILSIFIFMGCAETEFSSQAGSSIVRPEPTPPPVQFTSLSFDRDINTTTNIDMVWVVDNSTSMVEEIQLIRENLGRFLLSLEDRAQLNFTLITRRTGNFGMALSPWATSRGYRQISEFVDSFEAANMFLEFLPEMQGTSLRPDSQKILVLVTDDNSRINSNQFFSQLARSMDPNQLKVFGVVGLDRATSPCAERAGTHYQRMAQLTGGQTFNICQSDWTPYFDSLVKNVAQLTKTEFVLPQTPKGDLKVLIDGVATTKYKLEKNILVINPENFKQNKKYTIDVSYLP